MPIDGVALIVAGILVLGMLVGMLIGPIARWRRYQKLKKASWNPLPRHVDGYGDVLIHPMPVPLRLALQAALLDQSADHMSIYLWLIAECVDDLRGRSPQTLGMELSPNVIESLGTAVLDVAGLTKAGAGELEKKSEGVQN